MWLYGNALTPNVSTPLTSSPTVHDLCDPLSDYVS